MGVENNTVLISMDELALLLDLKTRVDVLIERIAHDDFFRTEDVLRIIGTDEAVELADKLREKEEERMKKFLMVLLSIAFVLNLAIVIGLIGGYGSPRRALYTITDELMNSAYRFKRGWQFKNSLP